MASASVPSNRGAVVSASVHVNRGAWCQLLSVLIGVRAHDSICISLMTYDVQHLFMGLCIICVSSLVSHLFGSLVHLLNQVVCFLTAEF